MGIIKHVGKHSNKKVVVLWNEIPGVEDMCLVVYTETLPRQYHDDLIQVLESPQGQAAKELNEVLHRSLLKDGRNILTTLHSEGWIKKVPTNQVIVTPTPSSSVRLDELNSLLKKMSEGEEAVKKLSELDSQLGMRDKAKKGAMPDMSIKTTAANISEPGILDDTALSQQRLDQAKKMRAEAEGLLAEAKRLEKEAKDLAKSNGSSKKKETTAAV